MSVNKHLPHVLLLAEDDANCDIANGFLLEELLVATRMRVLLPSGGWLKVLEEFTSVHIAEMDRYPARVMILLIDLDGQIGRLTQGKERIPERLRDRVFILGAQSTPEKLKASLLASYESIGRSIAEDCRNDTLNVWQHDLLRHYLPEVERLREHVRPILFPSQR